MTEILILGCGYTGRRVAERVLQRGARVIATTRNPESLEYLRLRGACVVKLDSREGSSISRLATPGMLVLHSIPLVEIDGERHDPTPNLLRALGDAPSRIVYLSTTSVYGDTREVDEHTPVAPRTLRERLRVDAERAVLAASATSLVLRPAAIYGPWRGVHTSLREGRFRLRGGKSNYISRIHVDDLATQAEAALLSTVTGAFPVADEEPCPSLQVAEFCSALLGVPVPYAGPDEQISETRRNDRRVDGSAIRRLLNVELRFPSYRTGIPAAMEEERAELT